MNTTVASLSLEDFEVGQCFVSAEHALNAQQVMEFGRQFDPQPFHTDPKAAESSFFHGLAASGWHVAALTMRLLVDCLPIGSGIIGAGAQAEWPRATRPEDRLHVRTRVMGVVPSKSKPDRGIVQLECLTVNQHEHLLQKLQCKVVVFRRLG